MIIEAQHHFLMPDDHYVAYYLLQDRLEAHHKYRNVLSLLPSLEHASQTSILKFRLLLEYHPFFPFFFFH